MGEVWRARHRMLGRGAAIKLIRPDAFGVTGATHAETLLRRFEREAKATSTLTSTHTIQLFDYGVTDDGTFYYVMELLQGLNFKQLVEQYGPLEANRAIHLLQQVCESLEEAHHHGLIHRDVKPANAYVCKLGLKHDFVKVLDFGLVKTAPADEVEVSNLTTDGTAPGSPAFLSPESVAGRVDARTDIYSLGCVAYWLLTGQLVFGGATPLEMVLDHLEKTPEPPSHRTELPIPEALEQLVLDCLQKDPAQRPQTMKEVAQRLAACPLERRWSEENAAQWWERHRPAPPPVGTPGTPSRLPTGPATRPSPDRPTPPASSIGSLPPTDYAAPADGVGLDPTVRLALTLHANLGAYACLLGSEISSTSGVPTGWGMVLDLASRVAGALGETCGDDPAGWYQTRYGEEPGYSKLLLMVAPTPTERQRLLRGYFEPTDAERHRGIKVPTAAHRAVADLVKRGVVRVLVTTSFDRLLERALEDAGVAPRVISTPADLAGVPPLGEREITVIKVHGDYLDAKIKNSPRAVDAFDPTIDALLDRVFSEHGLIVSGWSGQWDTALVRAIERNATPPHGTFWTCRRPPKGNAARLLALRRGEFVQIEGPDAFFSTLAGRVATLFGTVEAPRPKRTSVLALSSLPTPTSAFVGRRALLETLADRLAEARLLTLHGAGGVGKTRLAIQLATRVRDKHPDGVWFIDLAPEAEPQQVPAVLADTLGVAAERLGEVLSGLCTLLVMDNCEHLVDAVAAVVDDLLGAAPELTVLATSRTRLGLRSERVHSVAPMVLPAEGASDVQAVAESEAVQLFVERAQDVNDRFNLTSSNAADVARVVRTLDGVPLALELAAARTRVLPIARLADRLTDVFKVLPKGHRDARPHQQTLAAVWDWSWDLLTEAERRLCERLSVFRGGFSLEAAEGVASDEVLPAEDVLDALAELVDKSMIVPRPGEQGRYGMLEMVRQYSSRRLTERGELTAVQARHAAFFLELAKQSAVTLGDRHPDEMYRRLIGEDDNLHAAAEWLLTHGRPEEALAFATAVGWYFWYRRKGELVFSWLERALEAAEVVPDVLRARGLGIAGWLGFGADRDRAQERLGEASAQLERLGHPIEATWFVGCRALNQLMLGDTDGAATLLESRWRDLPKRTVAYVCVQVVAATVHHRRGELTEALAACDEGLRYQRDTYELLPPLYMRLMTLCLLARAQDLRETSERFLVCAKTQRDPVSAVGGLRGLAFAQILEGDVSGALATTHRMLDTLATLSRGDLVFYTGYSRIGRPRPGDAEAGADLVEHLLKQPRAAASRRVLELLLRASVHAAAKAGEDEGAARLAEALKRLRGANGEA
jgi:predicted ATPase/serine/threonine protein kinase